MNEMTQNWTKRWQCPALIITGTIVIVSLLAPNLYRSRADFDTLFGLLVMRNGSPLGKDKPVGDYQRPSDRVAKPRVNQVPIGLMILLRGGHPHEETENVILDTLYWGVSPPVIVGNRRVGDEGTRVDTINLKFNWWAMDLGRASGADHKTHARIYLIRPTDTQLDDLSQDSAGQLKRR